MKEIVGDLWDYLTKPKHIVCVTTNGFVKKNGESVMGRGCAKEAAELIPDLPILVGAHLLQNGNHVGQIKVPVGEKSLRIITFPVKHNWWEDADLVLIRTSAYELGKIAKRDSDRKYILPRPGCGNGRRKWSDVKKVIADILPDNVLVIDRPEGGAT